MKIGYKESIIIKVEKNFMTTTVGAISAFEEEFGDLMEDPEFAQRFQKARKRAFDVGNDQKRKSNRMLSKLNIERPRYDYQFTVGEQMDPDELTRIIGGQE
tara:strand:- start:1430 stop:1732 length:303 start_codon:yes stop_codon:yes gene_type:complete